MKAYEVFYDKVLNRTDPERIHHASFAAIRAARPVLEKITGRPNGSHEAMGLSFPGRLGLAAGFDKNAVGIDALAALGFGFVEVGTVTGLAQPGNPKPRLFRLTQDAAILNRMGFNNDGAAAVAARLEGRRQKIARRQSGRPGPVLGINIGKSKMVPEERAVEDYTYSARLLAPYADYLVVNVSSPNTPGLRDLQAVEKLAPLLEGVRRAADQVTTAQVPLLVKIAPDLADADVEAVADLAISAGLDGIVATNTTIDRSRLQTENIDSYGAGGISGQPVRQRAREVLRQLRDRVGSRLTLVSAGGIDSVAEAQQRIAAGADLLQAYTGFIYGGPAWPSRVNAALGETR